MSNDACHCGFCRDRAGGCEYCHPQRKHEALVLEELRRIGQALARGDSEARRRELQGPVVLQAQNVMVMLPGSPPLPPAGEPPEPTHCPPHRWLNYALRRRRCELCGLPQRREWTREGVRWVWDVTVVADYPVARGKVRTASGTRGSTLP